MNSTSREGRSEAPWTIHQCDKLNEFQRCGWVHEFTCANTHQLLPQTLYATPQGWVCPSCNYTQRWAHAAMLDGAPPNPFPSPAAPAAANPVQASALRLCAAKFLSYCAQHLAKGTDDGVKKATTNAAMAEMCLKAIGATDYAADEAALTKALYEGMRKDSEGPHPLIGRWATWDDIKDHPAVIEDYQNGVRGVLAFLARGGA